MAPVTPEYIPDRDDAIVRAAKGLAVDGDVPPAGCRGSLLDRVSRGAASRCGSTLLGGHYRRDPLAKASLKRRRLQGNQDAANRIVRGDAVRQFQMLL